MGAVEHYAELLAEEGVLRGLIGPREVPRLWERHILNCAAVAQLMPDAGTVVDLGSGAGLPGIVLAAMRPDLDVVLLEPMERRTAWLEEVRSSVGLDHVRVRRGRAEDMVGQLSADAVTARAVASMDRLVPWAMPLLKQGGVLLAMKGDRGPAELEEARAVIDSWGGGAGEVVTVGTVPDVEATTVVRVVRERAVVPSRPQRPARRRRRD
ncbi:16S rRNA (guanine(527)-N(7))-methyltransferase RsmG [Cellulomonas carbonis]|uniref:Ribosomal RNA small subunit methyltransferase G n=1 Tax=Cellulomonas carbonis T26 TaxID=947969 RepID=A0A0A0BX72_9CELL|nr:16S rRNA (guanine(527)-N(7))-methyltransferase RsmG [Cellulomonas carbonis]KGM12262.1 16S rRNA methyltransferase [Cellulomonas carbonis T26]